jgi:hypothetical protein
MNDLPKTCSTRADYDNIRAAQIGGWQGLWRQLLDGRFAVLDGDLVEDPRAPLFILGFSVAEVEAAIGVTGYTIRELEWFEAHPDRYQLTDGVWSEIEGWRAARDAAELARAVAAKVAEIEAESRRRQSANFSWLGNAYCADAWATKTIESCCAVAGALGMSAADPIRVPYPLQSGYWMTADMDAAGNRVMIYLTVGDMRQLLAALYDRNGSVWGKEVIHKATVEAMAGAGATVAEIETYDCMVGWL